MFYIMLCSLLHVFRVRARIQEVESEQTQERFFRPHFLQAPGDMLAHEGKLCRLDCKVGSMSERQVKFLKDICTTFPKSSLFHLPGEWPSQSRADVVG